MELIRAGLPPYRITYTIYGTFITAVVGTPCSLRPRCATDPDPGPPRSLNPVRAVLKVKGILKYRMKVRRLQLTHRTV